MTLVWKSGWNGLTEPEAIDYVAAVEAADGQELEFGVAKAINDFVVGCKADGIWNAIKASCILAGARTLDGALVPLVGTAPTNFNFVSADYDRETGLVGDGSTKYLDSNRAADADPQNNSHASVHVSVTQTGASGRAVMGALSTTPTLNRSLQLAIDNGKDIAANRSVGFLSSSRPTNSFATGMLGTSRNSSVDYDFLFTGTTLTKVETSLAPISLNIYVFAQNLNGTVSVPTNARLAFYSIGESLDLALLDTRVSNLITAIGAAIP